MITLTKHINLSSLRKEFVSALALFVACLFMGSCQSDIVNYNDGYAPGDAQPNTGEPVIEAIYDVADTQQSSPLAEGTPRTNPPYCWAQPEQCAAHHFQHTRG